MTPLLASIAYFRQYELALALLEAGADFTTARPGSKSKTIHVLLRQKQRQIPMSPQQKKDYEAVVAWLEAHGESMESAAKDLQDWKSSKHSDE